MNECPRCLQKESQEHVIQYSETRHMRVKFILEVYKELKSIQTKEISNNELRAMIKDIRQFMKNEEEEDFETNQSFIGMKQLFRGIIIRAWFGTNFEMNKYVEYNKIIVQYCMKYYWQCWIDRNEIINDSIVQ